MNQVEVGTPENVCEPKISVGATLRSAREARGLTIEAIARSLRLNPKYLTALEADQFAAFPAPPYVRVYIRAAARYLGLDPDQTLELYFRQTGQARDHRETVESQTSGSTARHTQQSVAWPAVAFLVVILAAIGFIARRINKHPETPVAESPITAPADTISSRPDSLPDTSTTAPAIAPPAAETETLGASKPLPAPATNDSLVLTITVQKDSVWMQVFADGKSWKGTVRTSRTFRAADSLNVHVGHNAAVSYTLNGVPFTPSDNKGVAVFKVTRSGVREWSLERWKSVFQGRL